MSESATPVLGLIEFNAGLFEKALGDVDRAELARRTTAGANPLAWIAGHLVTTRFSMAKILGQERPSPLAPVFGMGATVPEDAALPDAGQLLCVWREISGVVARRLSEATEEELAAASTWPQPLRPKTVLTAITFLAYHEGYHLGQMALIRKGLGRPGLVGC